MNDGYDFKVDTHVHTISSGHAYSTVQEIAAQAALKGLEAFAITDHGPSLPGGPCFSHFVCLKFIPEKINGVRIIRGAEANIMNYGGELDIPRQYLRYLEFVMASLHDGCVTPSTAEEHTAALVKVLENPYVDCIAHPGNPLFPVDVDKVVKAAAEYGKLIEINNHSFIVRKGSEANCVEFARKCEAAGVKLACGSDSHISFSVGNFSLAYKLLTQAGIKKEQVVNNTLESFEEYLKARKKRIK